MSRHLEISRCMIIEDDDSITGQPVVAQLEEVTRKSKAFINHDRHDVSDDGTALRAVAVMKISGRAVMK